MDSAPFQIWPDGRFADEDNHHVKKLWRLMAMFVLLLEPGHGQAVLTRIPEIRSLSPVEAEKRLPVKIRGVVTWADPVTDGPFVVDDGTQGIWVATDVSAAMGIWTTGNQRHQWKAGEQVEIEGVTDPGGYAPVVLPRLAVKLGNASLPPARPAAIGRMQSGADDAQRIEIRGVVQQAKLPTAGSRSTFLTVALGDDRCVARVEGLGDFDPAKAESFVDAEVVMRGVFTPVPNLRGEMVGLRVHVAGWEDVEVLVPAPDDPFAAPVVELDRLLPFSPDGNTGHRKVTLGTVSFSVPGEFFFLQDGITGVRVWPEPGVRVERGERVEVSGFVDKSSWLASLAGAVVRKTSGDGGVPASLPVTAKQILHPELWNARMQNKVGDCDGRLVRMKGTLRKIEETSSGQPLLMRVESDDVLFSVAMPGRTAADARHLEEGAEIALTGVCELIFGDRPWEPAMMRPSGFKLWVHSSADIRVLRSPSWWTLPRLAAALGIALAALLGAVIWIRTLQRAVRRHAVSLEEAMRHHRDAELEFLSARKERLRLATDLHDGLQQMIIGVGFRMEAALAYLRDIPDDAREEFQAARKTLMGTLTGLRECLWGLRHVDEGPGDFSALLRHGIDSIEHWPRGAVTVETHGEPYVLSRDLMGNLLLLVQEAIGNAFRHGQAAHVRVMLNYDTEGLELTVRDDGSGFDPATALAAADGHFGIDGMRERTGRMGGRFHLSSTPGEGTRIEVRIPRTGGFSEPSLQADER